MDIVSVCIDCGEKYGKRLPSMATWHRAECDICGNFTACTEPRDYGYLDRNAIRIDKAKGKINEAG